MRHFKLVEDNNIMLKSMKTELKEDFNDYVNKVKYLEELAGKKMSK